MAMSALGRRESATSITVTGQREIPASVGMEAHARDHAVVCADRLDADGREQLEDGFTCNRSCDPGERPFGIEASVEG